MRKLSVLLIVVASLAAAGAAADRARPAAAASQTVTITHTGYTPSAVSISVGDTVVFSNKDTVAHTVDFKSTTGMNCTAALPLVIQPTQGASCTFSSAGKFNFSDPASKGNKFRGSVTVAQSPTSSLTVTPKTALFGRKVTLAGTLASLQSGQSVQVLAQQCGASTSTIATVTTTTGGAFSYQPQPLKQTAYSVKSHNATSSALTVKVLPRIRLAKIARHRYSVHVFAAESFGGKYATFQRYRSGLKRWVKVKLVLLRANASGVAPTVITSTAFRSGIKAGLRVRLVLGQAAVGSCYLPGRSNTIRS
jgi:plastocyanin